MGVIVGGAEVDVSSCNLEGVGEASTGKLVSVGMVAGLAVHPINQKEKTIIQKINSVNSV